MPIDRATAIDLAEGGLVVAVDRAHQVLAWQRHYKPGYDVLEHFGSGVRGMAVDHTGAMWAAVLMQGIMRQQSDGSFASYYNIGGETHGLALQPEGEMAGPSDAR